MFCCCCCCCCIHCNSSRRKSPPGPLTVLASSPTTCICCFELKLPAKLKPSRQPPAYRSALGRRDMTSCSCASGMKLSSLAYVSVNPQMLGLPFSTTYGSSAMLAFILVTCTGRPQQAQPSSFGHMLQGHTCCKGICAARICVLQGYVCCKGMCQPGGVNLCWVLATQ